ncbi:exodeoxyribonuclease V subunit gamma [Buchnera aphidicola (Hormaphis cornu)]|nr:exodeoxyribonuclease V subunit gamma [Buchnera aphidicola (Hormaphis cornu)]
MIEVHISNQTDKLIQKICEIFQMEPLSNPLQKEIFIVDNKQVEQWIKIAISQKIGISANIKFYQPFNFFLKILKKKSINFNYLWKYNNSNLFWQILYLQDNHKINIPFLKKHDSQIKKFKFTLYVSKMFQNYLKYRLNWLHYWNLNINVPNITSSDQKWQKELWMLIIKYNLKLHHSKWNDINLCKLFDNIISTHKKQNNTTNNRIFVFGIQKPNSMYLSILSKISTFQKVILLYNSPHSFLCKKTNKFTPIKTKTEKNHKKFLHPILKKFGKNAFLNFLCINSISTNIQVHISKKNQHNLLKKIQCNILNKQITVNKKINSDIQNNITKASISPQDHSISIHICHNLQREIEILKDQLLHILNTNPKIMPYDIVIKATNINIYTNFINGVFGSLSRQYFIPYVIADNNILNTDCLVKFFDKILSLPKHNFDVYQFLSFLRNPLLSKKFFFS